DRRSLWKDLHKHKISVKDRPWVILGDFNACLDPSERSFGCSKVTSAMNDFKDYVSDIEVEDTAMSGLQFTWNKKPGMVGGLLKKLDRVLGNIPFMTSFLSAFARFLPFMLSDHTPAMFVIPEVKKSKHKPFKFHNYLSSKEDFIPTVKNVWSNKVEGIAMFSLVSKLKLLKKPEMEAKAFKAYKSALRDEESFLKQKAKIQWLDEGDKNSKYFHNVIKFVKHFKNVLGSSSSVNPIDDLDSLFSKVLSDSDAEYINRSVTDDEIRKALFEIDGNKAPGPDGYSAQFFKHAWNVVGSEVCMAVKDFFKNGKILKEINATIISLVPKIDTPLKVFDFHPIACCNVIYKIISKIISNRLKGVLGFLVDVNQCAFIPSRQISDNILISQELIRGCHIDRGFAKCAFKIDIQKAYDSVEWEFLACCLKAFKFHDTLIRQEGFKTKGSPISLSVYACDGDSKSVSVLKKALDEFGGVPLLSKRLYVKDCRLLIDKVKKRICDWKKKVLSFAGRLQLVQSVLSSMQVFWASFFILPKSIAADVERLLRDFIWNYGEFKKESLWVKWINVYKLKGRSFWDISDKAGIRWAWKNLLRFRGKFRDHIVHRIGDGCNTSLWFNNWHAICPLSNFISRRDILYSGLSLDCKVANVIKNGVWDWPSDLVCKFDGLFVIQPPSLIEGKSDKVVWRNIQGRIKDFFVSEVWNDIRSRNLLVLWSRLVCEMMIYVVSFAKRVWIAIITSFFSVVSLRKSGAAHCSSLIDKVKSRLFNWKNKSLSFAGRLQLIKSVVISTQVYWASSFILPKAVNAEIEQLMRGFLWSHVLFLLPPPIIFHDRKDRVLWKSNNGKIGDFSVSNVWADLAEEKPMVAWHKINVWQENVVTKCSLCEVGSESHNHLFFECPYSLEVWQQFKDVVKLVIGSMVYFIWLERNLRRFQDKRRPVKDLCGIIRGNVWLRLMSLKIKKSVQVMEAARLWDFGVEECNGESGSLDSHLKFSFGSSVENNEDCALSKAYEHNDFVNGNDGYFICVSCDKSLLLDDQCKPVAKSSGLMNGLDPTCMGDVGPSDRGKLASMEDVVGTGLVSSSPMDGIASDKGGDKFEFGKISSSKGILNKPNKPMFTLNFGPNVKMSNPFMEKPIGSSAWNAWGSNAGSSFGPTILSNQFSVDAERFVEKLKKGLEEVALKMKYVPSAVSKMENGNKRIMYQWKPPLCTHCKTFGHTILACKLRPKTDVERAAKIVKDASSLKGPLEENYNAMKSDEEGFFQVGKNNKSSNKGNGKGRLSKSCHSSGIVRPSQQCDSNQGNSSFGYGKYGNQQRYSYDKQLSKDSSFKPKVLVRGFSPKTNPRVNGNDPIPTMNSFSVSLWKSLQKYKQSFRNSPWVILGDFNATLDPSDKSSGCSKVTTAMSDFRDCVADIEVEDISISGLNFTWNKCPGKAGGLLKKLDRIMGNVDFITSFPTSYARFLPFM
nr:hypothetical protein [Tanacetum cinerariifolium]